MNPDLTGVLDFDDTTLAKSNLSRHAKISGFEGLDDPRKYQ
jgi:hypothetical protein